jgi:hypothetical protein
LDQTSTDPELVAPTPTLEEMLAAIEKFAQQPRMIGTLQGCAVWVNPAMPYLNIEFRCLKDGTVLMRAPVDHPYLKGTKLECVARAALMLEPNS